MPAGRATRTRAARCPGSTSRTTPLAVRRCRRARPRLQQVVVCGAHGLPARGDVSHDLVGGDDRGSDAAECVGERGVGGGRWVRGEQTVTVSARDNTGHREDVGDARARDPTQRHGHAGTRVHGRAPTTPGPSRFTHDSDPERAQYRVSVGAQDAAGNVATVGYDARVDNEPPERVRPAVVRRRRLARSTGSPSAGRTRPRPTPRSPGLGTDSAAREAVPSAPVDGQRRVADRDCSGRVRRAHARGLARGRGRQPVLCPERVGPGLTCGWTRRPPHWPSSHRARPTRSAWPFASRTATPGSTRGEIEMRQRGGNVWHSLATAREGQAARGIRGRRALPLRRLRVPRPSARDRAGNEASTDRRTTGARATIDLPARFATRADRRAPDGCIRRKKRRIVRLRPERDRTARLTAEAARPADQRRRPAARRRDGAGVVRLPGRRRRPGPGRASPGPIGEGRFTYVVACDPEQGPSVPIPGSRRIRPATADFELRVPGGQLHPGASAAAPQRSVRATERTGATRPLPSVREADRGAGLLPRALQHLLHHPRRRERALAFRLPLRGNTRPGALPPAGPSFRRRAATRSSAGALR